MMFLAGAVMFSSTVLMPQFLQILVGYTAEQAGLVVSVGAALIMVTMPVIGALTVKDSGQVPDRLWLVYFDRRLIHFHQAALA